MKALTAVLAIAPVYRGLGYVVFDHDATLLDWGTIDTRTFKPLVCLKRARGLLNKFAPASVILELTGVPSCRRKERIRDLISELAVLAEMLGYAIAFYDRGAVMRSLNVEGRATKDAMARAIADRLPPMAHRLPKPRRIWESERHAMAMFVAAGLGLAHMSSTDAKC